jgi:hypothetical protein
VPRDRKSSQTEETKDEDMPGKDRTGFKKRKNLKKTISKEKTSKILERVAPEKAFYFYTSIDKPTGKVSYSLSEFVQMINETDLVTIEFHASRGDFGKWISMLGYDQLAKQIEVLQKEKLAVEIFHRRFLSLLSTSLEELKRK